LIFYIDFFKKFMRFYILYQVSYSIIQALKGHQD
jgi:hypothetical protein